MSPPAMVKMEDAKFLLDGEVLAAAKSCMPTVDRFKVVKEDMKRRLKNTNMKPLSHSSYLRLQVLCQIFYDADEKLHVLDELSISDLKSFIPELCSQLYIEGLCHGNLLRGRSNYPVKYIQIEFFCTTTAYQIEA
ncbi:hypothetical protein ACFX13_027314 [Malus domestica]